MSPEERLQQFERLKCPGGDNHVGRGEVSAYCCQRCTIELIRAAEADARREALEEAAKLADETELVPLQGVLAKSKPDADYAYWVAEGFRILARRIRALASQKGEP